MLQTPSQHLDPCNVSLCTRIRPRLRCSPTLLLRHCRYRLSSGSPIGNARSLISHLQFITPSGLAFISILYCLCCIPRYSPPFHRHRSLLVLPLSDVDLRCFCPLLLSFLPLNHALSPTFRLSDLLYCCARNTCITTPADLSPFTVHGRHLVVVLVLSWLRLYLCPYLCLCLCASIACPLFLSFASLRSLTRSASLTLRVESIYQHQLFFARDLVLRYRPFRILFLSSEPLLPVVEYVVTVLVVRYCGRDS